ncbi:MAG: 30S ribosomal protein S6, partial [Raoultibacter sp.]
MKAYELLFFVSPSIDEESRIATMKRIETTI